MAVWLCPSTRAWISESRWGQVVFGSFAASGRKGIQTDDAPVDFVGSFTPWHPSQIYKKGADVHADPGVSYRNGEITIPYVDWIEPLHLECEDFANAIRSRDYTITDVEMAGCPQFCICD